MAKLSLSQQILPVIASPSLLVILREPFACCHSERSEESDTAQDKLRDRRISSSPHSEVWLTRMNSAKQSLSHFWDCIVADTRHNDIWR